MLKFRDTVRAEAPELLLKCLQGIESFHLHIVGVRNTNPARFNPIAIQQAPVEAFITEVLKILYGIYSAKFAELVEGIIESTNNENFLVFAYCGRGFVETAATLRFYNKKTNQLFLNAKNEDAYDASELREIAILLDKHARGGRFDWTEYWTIGRQGMVDQISNSTREKNSQKPMSNPTQVNVKTMLEAWVSEEPAISLIYDFFCEVVHPNLGSNFLVMGADRESLHVAGTRAKTIGRALAVEGIELLAPVIRDASACMAQLLMWKAMSEKAISSRSS